MSTYSLGPICSAIDNRSGHTVTVYQPYWSNDGRFPVIFQGKPAAVWIVAAKHLQAQHIINTELAVQYGFTQGPINEAHEPEASRTLPRGP